MQQQAVVAQQFGNTASAYLSSAVHAQGADLVRLKEAAAALGRPRVLDLGCGAGHASFAVAPAAAGVVAYDLAQPMLDVVAAAARERGLSSIETRQGNAAALPFADASFGMVVTRFSAHHWLDVPAALREVRRVLAPGGRCYIIDITAPEQPLYDTTLQAVELLRDGSHVRDYRPSEWCAMLAQAGLYHVQRASWALEMVFDDWVARMRTPPERVAAILSLWAGAPEEAQRHFQLRPDGSFTIDATLFEAAAGDILPP
jgi:ubiquinone/menaquinone biosynthesis C-methylase UbiE